MQNDIELMQSDIKLMKWIPGAVLACVVIPPIRSLLE